MAVSLIPAKHMMPFTDRWCNSFYIVGVVWNIFVATVIFFTYVETKGLTLEQVDKRLRGEPVEEVDVIDAYDGGRPITEGEMGEPAKGLTTKLDEKM